MQHVFREVGLSLHIDESENYELDIKSLVEIGVGDWPIC